MKAALGILLIVGGFTIGYLVLIGKLPTNTNTATPQKGLTEQPSLSGGGSSGGNLTPGIGGAALFAAKGMIF